MRAAFRSLALLTLAPFAGPSPASALPICTTFSIVTIPGYQCELGGLLFGNFVFDFQSPDNGPSTFGHVPTGYEVVFNLVRGQVVLTYVSFGEGDLYVQHQDDPGLNYPPPPELFWSGPNTGGVTISYDVMVDPATPYRSLLGLSSAFSPDLSVGGGGYFAQASLTQFLRASIGNASAVASQQVSVDSSGTVTRTSGTNHYGHNLSTIPLSTGNILPPGAVLPGTAFNVVTGQMVGAASGLNAPSFASAFTNAQWSTTFTITPEPGTTVLVATGFLGLFGLTWVRRRRRS